MLWIIDDKIKSGFSELDRQSDRAIAIVGGSYLEHHLTEAIKSRLHVEGDGHKRNITRIFDLDGPMGSFGFKIRVAYALGVFGHEAFTELEAIQKIRNLFAHKLTINSFDDDEIKSKSLNLRIISLYVGKTINEIWSEYVPDDFNQIAYAELPKSPKDKYLNTCQLLSFLLYKESAQLSAPTLNIPNF